MHTERNKTRFWLRTLLIIIAIAIHQIFLPWWGLVLACMLSGYLTVSMGKSAFLSGFGAAFLTWGLVALYMDLQNNSLLSSKVIRLLPVPEIPVILVIITAMLGGLMGGFACKAGDLFRRFSWKEKARYY